MLRLETLLCGSGRIVGRSLVLSLLLQLLLAPLAYAVGDHLVAEQAVLAHGLQQLVGGIGYLAIILVASLGERLNGDARI